MVEARRKKKAGDVDERRGLRAARERGGQLCSPSAYIPMGEEKRQIDKGISCSDASSAPADSARPPTMVMLEKQPQH